MAIGSKLVEIMPMEPTSAARNLPPLQGLTRSPAGLTTGEDDMNKNGPGGNLFNWRGSMMATSASSPALSSLSGHTQSGDLYNKVAAILKKGAQSGTGSGDAGSGNSDGDGQFSISPSTTQATPTGNGEVSPKDVFDMLKFSFLLQETDLRNGELRNVPKQTHELWTELKDSLVARRLMDTCSRSLRHSAENCSCFKWTSEVLDVKDLETIKYSTGSKCDMSRVCPVGEAFRQTLAEVVNEGLLNSLLPYLTPSRKSANSNSGLGSGGSTKGGDVDPGTDSATGGASSTLAGAESSNQEDMSPTQPSVPLARKGTSSPLTPKVLTQGENESIVKSREVTIHVCDETRDAKRDFTCRQDLLLSQMGYFRDITTGQSLEDVDISVHCDVTIFEWLMAWLRYLDSDVNGTEDEAPSFEPDNVVSILVSASFLKMGPLVDLALKYVHRNMNKILTTTHNLNCLGDPLITRLAALYKPSEVEELMDRRDRIHNRLYTKLILALCKSVPDPEREIYCTAATLHRCRLCGSFLTQHLAKLLPCHPLRSHINKRGEVEPKHLRDPNFNLSDFLRNLRIELKSWRKVFWRLWGICHALYCSICSNHFPVYLYEFCSFHPHDSEFQNIQFKNSTQPFGHFPCCQTQVYRFQSLPFDQKGCQSRDHRVKIRNDFDSRVHKVLMTQRDLICLCPQRRSGIKIASAEVNSITLPIPIIQDANIWAVTDDFPQELCLIPPRRRRCLANRALWETLRTSVMQAALKGLKSQNSMSLVDTIKAATNQNSSSNQDSNTSGNPSFPRVGSHSSISTAGSRTVYGRLKRVPKLPAKPALQSSESSSATDDLSGSEESSSSCLEDGDAEAFQEANDGEEETALTCFDVDKDLCIEIKLGKDHDKPKTLVGSSSNQTATQGNTTGTRSQGAGTHGTIGQKNKPVLDSALAWMRWDPERTGRANQDHQREREEIAIRDLVRHLAKRNQQQQQPQTQPAQPQAVFPPRLGVVHHPGGRWANLQSPGSGISSVPITSHIGMPAGGSFLRLEQDWRETHMAYLQHRSLTAIPHGKGPATGRDMRPNSAASNRSARQTRLSRVGNT